MFAGMSEGDRALGFAGQQSGAGYGFQGADLMVQRRRCDIETLGRAPCQL